MRDPFEAEVVDLQRTERIRASAGVGGAHSTEEVGESRWREGALVLERFRRRGESEDWETWKLRQRFGSFKGSCTERARASLGIARRTAIGRYSCFFSSSSSFARNAPTPSCSICSKVPFCHISGGGQTKVYLKEGAPIDKMPFVRSIQCQEDHAVR